MKLVISFFNSSKNKIFKKIRYSILKKLNSYKYFKRLNKYPTKIRSIMLMVLIIGILCLTTGIISKFNAGIFNVSKKYENKLSFVEVNTNPKTKNDSAVAQISLKSDSSWAWPTEGANCYISQYFHSGHKAIDIAGCGHGSNIHAVHDGVVVTAGSKSMNGNYIVILHDNGYHTMYAHLSKIYVSVNQRVTKNTVIGAMGSTGYSTGTHLDFSVWKDGYPYRGGIQQNPLNFY